MIILCNTIYFKHPRSSQIMGIASNVTFGVLVLLSLNCK